MGEPKLNVQCPVCGQAMVVRPNRQTGEEFLGCSQYPRCTATKPIPIYIEMIRSGADQLPGFE